MATRQIFFITKYALTTGIIKARGRVCDRLTMIDIGKGQYFHGCDWHSSLEDAEARVAVMVQKKRAAILKQLAALEAVRLYGAPLEDHTLAKGGAQ